MPGVVVRPADRAEAAVPARASVGLRISEDGAVTEVREAEEEAAGGEVARHGRNGQEERSVALEGQAGEVGVIAGASPVVRPHDHVEHAAVPFVDARPVPGDEFQRGERDPGGPASFLRAGEDAVRILDAPAAHEVRFAAKPRFREVGEDGFKRVRGPVGGDVAQGVFHAFGQVEAGGVRPREEEREFAHPKGGAGGRRGVRNADGEVCVRGVRPERMRGPVLRRPAVGDAVAVGIGVERIGSRHDLGPVHEPVAVRVRLAWVGVVEHDLLPVREAVRVGIARAVAEVADVGQMQS